MIAGLLLTPATHWSAHVVVHAGDDCHERRHELQHLISEQFGIDHATLQVDHEVAPQQPLQIEVRVVPPVQAADRIGA